MVSEMGKMALESGENGLGVWRKWSWSLEKMVVEPGNFEVKLLCDPCADGGWTP